MADANKSPFTFGPSASSAPASSGSLFGTAAPAKSLFPSGTGGSLFSGQAAPSTSASPFGSTTATAPGGGLFGNNNNTTTSSGFKFNNTTTTTPAGPSLFGAGSTKTNTPAQPSTPASGNAPATSAPSIPSLFGNTSASSAPTAPSLFGNTNNNTTNSAAPSIFLTKPTPPTSLLFDSTPASTTANQSSAGMPTSTSQGPSVFGQGTTTAPAAGGLFQNLNKLKQAEGTNTPAKPLSFSSFTPAGNPPNASTGTAPAAAGENRTPAFGAAGTGKSLFGEMTSGTGKPATPSLFGANAQASAAPSLFGANTQAPTAPSLFGANTQAPTSNLFGNIGKKTDGKPAESAKPASNLFSGFGQKDNAAPATTQAPAPTSNLFGGIGSKPDNKQAEPSTTTANLFSGFGQKKDDATTSAAQSTEPTKPAASVFPAFGQKKDDATSSAAQPASTAATSTAPALGASLFGSAPSQPASSTTTTSAPTATANAGASLFGASTGNPPAASTTQQPSSRLASKSLDEIITTWSASLATHQKTFANVADRVAKWDRQLVQNSSSIGNLYSRVFQAERDTAEVERQLSNVENGQAELEARLSKYEAEVDQMLEAAGLGDEGTASGVDAERERTYHAAQECQTRLTDMGNNLTAMIEEINSASGKLSSRKADAGEDQLAQIVRVLNSHLAQLQVIDKGANALTIKVEQAQKEAGVAASRNVLGGGREWVEGFGRSYLGRR